MKLGNATHLKLAVLGLVVFASVASGDDIDSNPYVQLYQTRVEMEQSSLEGQRALEDFERARLDRLRRLLASNAVSVEEYQEGVSRYQMARWKVVEYGGRVREAQALLQVAKVRIAAGQDMPLCRPYE